MTEKENKIAAYMLRAASQKFANHGCNDLDSQFFAEIGLTDEEKIQFVREYHTWNGDLKDRFRDGVIEADDFLSLPDFAVMSFLAHKLDGQDD